MCLFSFLDDLILIYPLYAVMFAERGISTAEISVLLFAWSAVAFVLEVPTGGLADRFSRRHLLAGAQLFRAAGFLVWWLVPSFSGYLVGFALWGIESALTSGAFQALVYDELRAKGKEDTYAWLLGRSESCRLAAQVVGGLLAAVVVTAGFPPVLWASALVGLVAGAVLLSFPNAGPANPAAERRYLQYLREGLHQVVTERVVRDLVLFSGAIFGIGAVDEFFGLLLRDAGISNEWISIWHAIFFVIASVGSLLAHRFARASRRHLALIAFVWGITFVLTSQAGGLAVPLGLVVFNLFFSVQQIALDAQLQAAITSDARATITSVRGLASELFALGSFLVFGVVASEASDQIAAGVLGVAIVLAAVIYGMTRVRSRDA